MLQCFVLNPIKPCYISWRRCEKNWCQICCILCILEGQMYKHKDIVIKLFLDNFEHCFRTPVWILPVHFFILLFSFKKNNQGTLSVGFHQYIDFVVIFCVCTSVPNTVFRAASTDVKLQYSVYCFQVYDPSCMWSLSYGVRSGTTCSRFTFPAISSPSSPGCRSGSTGKRRQPGSL